LPHTDSFPSSSSLQGQLRAKYGVKFSFQNVDFDIKLTSHVTSRKELNVREKCVSDCDHKGKDAVPLPVQR
jgi:hypothetical protein